MQLSRFLCISRCYTPWSSPCGSTLDKGSLLVASSPICHITKTISLVLCQQHTRQATSCWEPVGTDRCPTYIMATSWKQWPHWTCTIISLKIGQPWNDGGYSYYKVNIFAPWVNFTPKQHEPDCNTPSVAKTMPFFLVVIALANTPSR